MGIKTHLVPSTAGGLAGLGHLTSALFAFFDSDRACVLTRYALEADDCCELIYFRSLTLINHGLRP